MIQEKNMSGMNEGDCTCVRTLLSIGTMRRRLQDLGLVEGTQVKCIQKSPYGDLVAYEIRGAIIALRGKDAENILID